MINTCSLYTQYVAQRKKSYKNHRKTSNKSHHFKDTFKRLLYQIFYISILITNGCYALEAKTKSLRFSDYCPVVGSCVDSSHVMCKTYSSQHNECEEIDNRTMSSEMAGYILQVTNAMRSRLALGIEKGKDGVTLPRGYGLKRLLWDPELATFAQIWADTCRNDKDFCHATKRFPDPGQFLVNFRLGASHTYPEMEFPDEEKSNGFTDKKLLKYVTSMLKYIFSRKNIVTPDIVHQVTLEDSSKSAYHQFMNGDVTHIGCGLSIFSKYYSHDVKNLIKNIKFVCNLSAKLLPRRPLYRTGLPGPEETPRCGCPQGYGEDEGCLCYLRDPNGPCGENREKCKPSVIVLPIVQQPKDSYPVSKPLSNSYSNPPKVKFDVRTRHFDNMPKKQLKKQKVSSKRKQSLFSEVPKFVLPNQHKLDDIEKFDVSTKRDVVIVPRKDFSLARGLVSNYLNTKHFKTEFSEDKTERNTNEMLKNIQADFDGYVDKNFRIKGSNESNIPGQSNYDKEYDANVMKLLDKLEHQIHDKRLNGDVKQVIDAKIRKLYGNIIGGTDDNSHADYSGSRLERQSFNEEHEHQHNHNHDHTYLHDQRFAQSEKRNFNFDKQGYMKKPWNKDFGYPKERQISESDDYSRRNLYSNYHNKNTYFQNRLIEDERNYPKNRFYHEHDEIQNRKININMVPEQHQYNMNRPAQRFVRPLENDNEERHLMNEFPINKRDTLTLSKM